MGLLDWLTAPPPGAKNSAYKNLPQGQYTIPVASDTPAASDDSSSNLQPDTMTDADRAYYAAAQNSPGLIQAIQNGMQPDPGAINTATLRNPNAHLSAADASRMALLGPAGFGGGGTLQTADTPAAASDTISPPGGGPPILPTGSGSDGGGGNSGGSASTATAPVTNIAAPAGAPDVTIPDQTGGDAAGGASAGGAAGGLLGSIGGSLTQAAQDPTSAKGLLSSFADTLKNAGDKLTHLSPAASQALIASGLTMLSNNTGGKNLAQLVGEGGVAGVNEYQNLVQTQAANQLARQKEAREAYKDQQDLNIRLNTPTQIDPGKGWTTPGQIAAGQKPTMPASMPFHHNITQDMPDGTVSNTPADEFNNPIGPPVVSLKPLDDATSSKINTAIEGAQTSGQSLKNTQNLISKLTPTIPDPNNPGKTIPNPDFKASPAGGIAGSLGNVWTSLTGDKTDGQQLRAEITNTIAASNLANYKGAVGGRLSNTDVGIMQKGMPSETASGEQWRQWLTAYEHLQSDRATKDQMNADYMQNNRGQLSPLLHNTVINGHVYPQGTSINQVMYGDSKGKPLYDDSLKPWQPPGSANQDGGQATPTPQPTNVVTNAPSTQGFAIPLNAVQAEMKRRGMKVG
jgi:hypothetical protein